jgi:lipid A 4'-phosphatase
MGLGVRTVGILRQKSHSAERMTLSPLALAALAMAAFSALVMTFPTIDRSVSSLFYQAGEGFPLAHDAGLIALRTLGRALPAALIVWLIGLGAVRLVRGRPFTWPNDTALIFLAATMAAGPGLVVNIILKSHWGRQRPLATDLFGGASSYTSPWWPWGECTSNCSFVSGEASAAMAMIAFAFIVRPQHRWHVGMAVLLWTIAISLNRIAFGAHYLSDVVLACGLTLIVVLLLEKMLLSAHADRRQGLV